MHALVALQHADGSWELTSELANALGRELSEIERALPGASSAVGWPRSSRDNRVACRHAWATALAIAWLELHAADAKEQWRLLRAKAEKWIENLPVDAAAGATWLEAARSFLTS
jgi:hypothetical protein